MSTYREMIYWESVRAYKIFRKAMCGWLVGQCWQSLGVLAHLHKEIHTCGYYVQSDVYKVRLLFSVNKSFQNLSVFHSSQIYFTHTACLSWFLWQAFQIVLTSTCRLFNMISDNWSWGKWKEYSRDATLIIQGLTRRDSCHCCHIVLFYHFPKNQKREIFHEQYQWKQVCISGHLAYSPGYTQTTYHPNVSSGKNIRLKDWLFIVALTSGPDVLPFSPILPTAHMPWWKARRVIVNILFTWYENKKWPSALLKYTENALKANKMITSFPHRRRLVHIFMTTLLVWKLEAPRENGIIKPRIMLWSSMTYREQIHDSSINISRKVTENTFEKFINEKEGNTVYFLTIIFKDT